MLTQRQWNQCRAALQFYLSVARTSSVHPIEHPAVRSFFEGGEHTPLTPGEIGALIATEIYTERPILWTVQQIANATGHSPRKIQYQLAVVHRYKPEMVVGNTAVYRLPNLLLVAHELDALKEYRHQREARENSVSPEEYQKEKGHRSATTRKGREALWAGIRRRLRI